MVITLTNSVSKDILSLVTYQFGKQVKKVTENRIQRTLTLSETLDEQLRAEAARLEMPISYLVEKAIAAYLPIPHSIKKDVA